MTALTHTFVFGAAIKDVEWGTIIVTLATFAILLALLKKFAWGPLKEVMDKRERDINKDIDEDRKSTRLNSSHSGESRMPSSA